MATERTRETRHEPPSRDELEARASQGWKLIAVEWERAQGATVEPSPGVFRRVEVAYGLRVSSDDAYLEEDATEVAAMILMLDLMVADQPLHKVAEELNRMGYRTRQGTEWNQVRVFGMVPRLVAVAPDIFGTADWVELRESRRERTAAAS